MDNDEKKTSSFNKEFMAWFQNPEGRVIFDIRPYHQLVALIGYAIIYFLCIFFISKLYYNTFLVVILTFSFLLLIYINPISLLKTNFFQVISIFLISILLIILVYYSNSFNESHDKNLFIILIVIFIFLMILGFMLFCNRNDCYSFLTSFKDFLLSLFNSFTSFISGNSQLIKDAPSLPFGLLYLASMGVIIYSAYELFNPTQNQSLSSKNKMILMIISFIFFVIFAIQTFFLISSEKTTSIFNIFGPLLFLGSIVASCYLIYEVSKTYSSEDSYSISNKWRMTYLIFFLLISLILMVYTILPFSDFIFNFFINILKNISSFFTNNSQNIINSFGELRKYYFFVYLFCIIIAGVFSIWNPRNIMTTTVNNYLYSSITAIFVLAFLSTYYKSSNTGLTNEALNTALFARQRIFVFSIIVLTMFINLLIYNPYNITKNYSFPIYFFLMVIIFTILANFLSFSKPKGFDNVKDKDVNFLYENFKSFSFIIFVLIFIGIVATLFFKYFGYGENITTKWYNHAITIMVVICILTIIRNFFSKYLNDKLIFLNFAYFLIFVGVFLKLILSNLAGYSDRFTGGVITLVLCILICMFLLFGYISRSPFNNNYLTLLTSIISYLPCLLFYYTVEVPIKEYKNTPYVAVFVILFEICIALFLVGVWYLYYFASNSYYFKGGKQILNEPIGLENNTQITDFYSIYKVFPSSISPNSNIKYNFSVSFWFFLDSNNSDINKDFLIFNYNYNPFVYYNPSSNTFGIKVVDGEKCNECKKKLTPPSTDEEIYACNFNNSTDIYTDKGLPLQKWNHCVLVYSSGLFDIFLNNELVKSRNINIPILEQTEITTGSNNGINGGICNMIFYTYSIQSDLINNLYHSVKDKNPPVPTTKLKYY